MMFQAITTCTKFQLKKVYEEAIHLLKMKGLQPKLQWLDNEALKLMTKFMEEENITYQLTPAGSHRQSIAEKAVHTFKNHFIVSLCSLPDEFPLNLWDKILPQAEITLNFLQPSRINPALSAYAQLHGAFNYNKILLDPPGMQVVAHIPPNKHLLWAPHAKPGFYLGPALHHYRCHCI